MLIKLTEIRQGVVDTNVVLRNKIVINTGYIQTIRKTAQIHPFTNDFTTILMANGYQYNVEEDFDYVYTKITENGTK